MESLFKINVERGDKMEKIEREKERMEKEIKERGDKLKNLKEANERLKDLIEELIPPCRERSVALTELETSLLWALHALAINDPKPDEAVALIGHLPYQLYPKMGHLPY